MKSIYEYSLPHLFLREAWKEKRQTNRNFTIRAWAIQLGLKAHNPLYEIINGKRKIPKKYIHKFAEHLKLSKEETVYFELLVDFTKASTSEEKAYYVERIKQYYPKSNFVFHRIGDYSMLEDPLNMVILEMLSLQDFQHSSSWIKRRLDFEVSEEQIQHTLERLLNLGLIIQQDNGSLQKSHLYLSTIGDKKDLAVQEYHQHVLAWASRAIKQQEISEREYNSYLMGVAKSRVPQAKERIRQFINSFIEEFSEGPSSREEIYCMSTQFFRITKDGALK